MTSKDAYTTFLLLANKLNSDDNVNIDIGRFVLLYNKHALVWLAQSVRKTKYTQEIDEIQRLVVKDVPLPQVGATSESVKFNFPADCFDFIAGYAQATRDNCKRVINASQVKNENERLILFDSNWRPDFDFEWLPVTIGGNSIQVFFKDFQIEGFIATYYRFPTAIDIAGYTKPDGVPSITVDPDIDDIYVNEIIDLVVADVSRIYQNNEKLPADLNRITTQN